MENTTTENNNTPEINKASYVSLKFKKPKPIVVAIGVADQVVMTTRKLFLLFKQSLL